MTEAVPASITYRFERADIWRLGRMLFRPTLKRRLLGICFLALCLVAGLTLGLGHWPKVADWRFVLRSPQILSLFFGMLVLSQFFHYFNILTLWLRFRQVAVAEQWVTLTFGPGALEAEVAGTRSSIPWQNFVGRAVEDDRVFLKLSRWEALTIPRRAFADDAAYAAALAFLRAKVPHGAT